MTAILKRTSTCCRAMCCTFRSRFFDARAKISEISRESARIAGRGHRATEGNVAVPLVGGRRDVGDRYRRLGVCLVVTERVSGFGARVRRYEQPPKALDAGPDGT